MLWPTVRAKRLAYPPRERWVRDAVAYSSRKRASCFAHTHLVRGGSVMLWPTVRGKRASCFAHTHLVRGGSVMLRPTVRGSAPHVLRIPTS